MDTLLGMFSERIVDFVKMDVEGAEKELLKTAEDWAHKVRCIKVEIHPPYSVAECLADFSSLGMLAELTHQTSPLAVTARWPG
jgi:hypothetical protein